MTSEIKKPDELSGLTDDEWESWLELIGSNPYTVRHGSRSAKVKLRFESISSYPYTAKHGARYVR